MNKYEKYLKSHRGGYLFYIGDTVILGTGSQYEITRENQFGLSSPRIGSGPDWGWDPYTGRFYTESSPLSRPDLDVVAIRRGPETVSLQVLEITTLI